MSEPPSSSTPVVEQRPAGDGSPDVTLRALEQRITQQEILAQLGVAALQGATFDQLLKDTARLTAEGLRAEFCKVLEHDPDRNRLLVRAGVGWNPGIIGVASVGAGLDSPAGYALRTGKPVISNHLKNEERFRTPEILRQHGVRRAMNVILQGDGRPYGVLEVDSRSESEFEEHDLTFLQGAANILGMAIERERHERRLKAALERDQVLLREMNHRVKNSLAIVSSMLNLQARDIGDAALATHLGEASARVSAIAKAHDQLSRNSHIESMDVGDYVAAMCRDLDASVNQCDVQSEVVHGIEMATERAISLALIINELIANAAKYAYPDRAGGKILIKVARAGAEQFTVVVRDWGAGLPADFDMRKPKGLGMRLVSSFTRQLTATIAVHACDPGTEVTVTIPLNSQA